MENTLLWQAADCNSLFWRIDTASVSFSLEEDGGIFNEYV
jgi:hypothetical protein